MDDTTLVQRARGGDDAAFAGLVEAYQSQVYNLAYRMLRQRQDAEDAAQETFLRAFRQLSTYRPEQRFSSWLLAIASHYCVDQLRRRKFLWLSLEDVPIIGNLISREPQPESAALAAEKRDEMAVLLNCLPPQYRLVTVLRYNYDLPTAEIAAIVGSTDGAVKTQLCRARDMLAAEIRKQTPSTDGGTAGPVLAAPFSGAARNGRSRGQELGLDLGLGLGQEREDVTNAL
jgi:RNA polymerase sigma-70 factor, ECF subfamily